MFIRMVAIVGGVVLAVGWLCPAGEVAVTIDPQETAQVLRNIGASSCWYAEAIGRHWPAAKRERIARWLFSRELDPNGAPLGIGLSAWRFNIGAGTAEQGPASGIRDPYRRVACLLGADGRIDASRQAGALWFARAARRYGVADLIAFSNSPPVTMTRNGLGFKTDEDDRSNLRPDRVEDFAGFLVAVLRHLERDGLHFDFLSPVNEPQWDWRYQPGDAKQEGSPWRNDEIAALVRILDRSLRAEGLTTRILIPEAARLDYLAAARPAADAALRGQQLRAFWDPASPLYLGDLPTLTPFVAGHGYFTDTNDTVLIETRRVLADAIRRRGGKVEFWQTEYCLLGDGYRQGRRGRLDEMDHALFLAKVIHHDLVVAQASAWHFWNAFEPGSTRRPRYYLIALSPRADGRDGDFAATKTLWALGHYSRFVRPGMHRLRLHRNDGAGDLQAASGLMVSAFADAHSRVLVAVNMQATETTLAWNWAREHDTGKTTPVRAYLTTADPAVNLQPQVLPAGTRRVVCPPQSIVTVVMGNGVNS